MTQWKDIMALIQNEVAGARTLALATEMVNVLHPRYVLLSNSLGLSIIPAEKFLQSVDKDDSDSE